MGTVNLSIKSAPKELIERIRERAKRNHRSLQGEVLSILEEAMSEKKKRLTPREVLELVRATGLSDLSESATLVRESRDGR